MEYFLCRAMDISRLLPEEIEKLQAKERNMGRGMAPFETSHFLEKGTIRDHWGIPDDEGAMKRHNERIREGLGVIGLKPKYDFSVTDVEKIHEWDWKVYQASNELKIDMAFQERKGRRLKELVAEVVLLGIGLAIK